MTNLHPAFIPYRQKNLVYVLRYFQKSCITYYVIHEKISRSRYHVVLNMIQASVRYKIPISRTIFFLLLFPLISRSPREHFRLPEVRASWPRLGWRCMQCFRSGSSRDARQTHTTQHSTCGRLPKTHRTVIRSVDEILVSSSHYWIYWGWDTHLIHGIYMYLRLRVLNVGIPNPLGSQYSHIGGQVAH